MNIGITAHSFDKTGYGRWGKELYKKLKSHGFSSSYFDMSVTESLIYTLPEEEAKEILLNEKKMATEAGIEINQVHGPWRYPVKDGTEEDRAERMEKMKKSIRMTSYLGCRNFVIHPIMPCGLSDIGKEQITWDVNVAFMKELVKTAKEYNVTVCIENMPFTELSLSKPEAILKLVREINDENFKSCFDTGHVSVFENLDCGEEIRRLGKEVRVLHVHDNKYGIDLHMLPYFGTIDWDSFSKALKDTGYDGCFLLETMPSRKLPDDIFEEMCISVAKTAKHIISL